MKLFYTNMLTKGMLPDKCKNLKKSSRTTPSVYDNEIFVISHCSWSKQFENKSVIPYAELTTYSRSANK